MAEYQDPSGNYYDCLVFWSDPDTVNAVNDGQGNIFLAIFDSTTGNKVCVQLPATSTAALKAAVAELP